MGKYIKMSGRSTISIDLETRSEADLKSVGLAEYMRHPSTKVLMAAWSIDRGSVQQVDLTDGQTIPCEVKDALTDPHVERWAFNAAFERYGTKKLLGIATPFENWKCSMALSFMRSFQGGLDDVGKQIGLPEYETKDPIGKKLVKLFSMPQKPTRAQPHRWCDRDTHPYSWQEFLSYNRQDVVAEMKIADWLLRFPTLDDEWRLYEIDQIINDRGLPVDRQFVVNGQALAWRRKAELAEMMREAAQFAETQNPASTKQLLPWLKDRGYPFNDLQKNTIKKVLNENEHGDKAGFLAEDAVSVLKLRQQANRTSVRKLDAMLSRLGDDDRLRHCFQFAGASRTSRWSGRGPQPQNLVRTPKFLEERPVLEAVTEAVRDGDYDWLHVLVDEPMSAIAGAMRSAFRAPEGYEFVVCDLSAIESAVIAWLSGCNGMLEVFRKGLDPYISFGTKLYSRPYASITKGERFICKPAVLGCGYGLGGGRLREGKRTGLWGYAEAMGVEIDQQEAQRQVNVFREAYFEIPELWARLEDGFSQALKGREVRIGRVTMSMRSNFLTVQLPSGRLMFYYRPLILPRVFEKKDGGTYEKKVFTCMGKQQGTNKWTRINVGGPKAVENLVQATARDVLALGMRRAHDYGFKLVGSVHDELIALRRKGDNYFTLEALKQCMIEPVPWLDGLPLGADGYVGSLYRKG
jgi:DNA polymerase